MAATAAAADAGNDAASDSGRGCATSGECAPPAPYCAPSNHACVECLSDKNCAAPRVCNEATNACVACVTDVDCAGERPHCDGANGCVECLSDANCSSYGVKCYAGHCGQCGDGVCGPHEKLIDMGGFTFGAEPLPSEFCAEDCAKECPTTELSLDQEKRVPIGAQNVFVLFGERSAPDVSLSFTAPSDGTFYVSLRATQFLSASTLIGGCAGVGPTSINGDSSKPFPLALARGQTVVILVESLMPVTLVASVSLTRPPCEGDECALSSDAGTPADQGRSLCLRNARERGEATCDGVTCACQHCPQDYDDCGTIPGCVTIEACMRETRCTGIDCYESGECRSVVDANGGKAGPAFSTAVNLQSCSLTFSCALPCGIDVTPPADGGTDGVGATARDASATAPRPVKRHSSCDCDVGRTTRRSDAGTLGLAMAVALAGLRRRRSPAKGISK
jgi:MYXO-CTERM domain-containing protein